MEEALVAKLLEASGLVSLVGQRITWGRRQQGAPLPAVVLHLISNVPVNADEGDLGLDDIVVQIDCLASDADGSNGDTQSLAVARAVRAALGNVEMIVDGVTFQGVFLENVSDSEQAMVGGVPVSRRWLQFNLWPES